MDEGRAGGANGEASTAQPSPAPCVPEHLPHAAPPAPASVCRLLHSHRGRMAAFGSAVHSGVEQAVGQHAGANDRRGSRAHGSGHVWRLWRQRRARQSGRGAGLAAS